MGGIDATTAKALLHEDNEVALIDVREAGQYGEGHPFLAVNCPYSGLEHNVVQLVPRLHTPIILLDSGDGIAEMAAAKLSDMGYRAISFVSGGISAWQEAGFTLFKGVNLPSKTLGELVEELWRVPHLDADTLAAWQEEGRAFELIDGRPVQEFRKSTVPGARSMPNAELPHRYDNVVSGNDIPVVIHCAGRTRSIIGAAGFALAGMNNPVYALENGTQGWALSGRKLAYDSEPQQLPPLDAEGLEASRCRAAFIIRRYDIPVLDVPEAKRLAADVSRTCYVFDVRSAEEFAAGTIGGAVHAPAVQLVQATDQWMGVRRARVILTCDTGLRSAITTVFLRAMGYDVCILVGAPSLTGEIIPMTGPASPPPSTLPPVIEARELTVLGDTEILDLRPSQTYREAHLQDASWGIRPRLQELPERLDKRLILIGEEPQVRLVAADLRERYREILWLEGGPEAWRRAGLRVIATPHMPEDRECIDFLFFVHDRHDGNLESARRYLAWELGLVAQLDAMERAMFQIGPSPFS